MMQHVATAKSGIAAFATGTEANSFADTESNEQFGKLLQDEKSLHSLVDASETPAPYPPPYSRTKQTPSSAVKEERETQAKSMSNEQADVPVASKDGSTTKSASEYDVADESEHYCADEHVDTGDNSGEESATNDLNDELEVGNTEAELVLSSTQSDTELSVEPASIVAQEWVALVDNLQKLAEVAKSTEGPLVETDLKSHDIDITENESRLPQVDDKSVAESISILVDEALSEVLTSSELTDLDFREKMAELLLEQPEALQNLLSKLQTASQEDDSDTVKQENVEITVDNVVDEDSLSASQAIETDEQVDFTLAENKALLRALLVDADMGKNPVQGPIKVDVPEIPEKPMGMQQTEALITKLEPVVEQSELLAQNVQAETKLEPVVELGELLEKEIQVEPSKLLSSSKTDKVTNNNDINNILNLTESQQNKVLDNIAQQVFDSKKTAEPVSAEQVPIPKVAEIIRSVESPAKDFVSALKSGLEEFKEQLSQGREPGIDLKALVSDALGKTTDTETVIKTPANLEQVVNRVSQMLDFAQTVNSAIEHRHDQAYSATLRDVAQIQGEQSKQIQLSQVESKFEKAINITKPEGHQQLAEKVRWMANTKNLIAEIRLDPAELGSMHVKVAMSGESASVNFVVQSQQARDAIDTATPKLREMLAEKGIELGQSSVREESDGQQGQGDGSESDGQQGNYAAEDVETSEQVLAQQNIVNGALGGIDYFV